MFSFSFLVYAFLGALLSGISLAVFAPFVTLRRISYLGEALSHIAFAGIAIAILTGLNLTVITLIFVMLIALGITLLAKRHNMF